MQTLLGFNQERDSPLMNISKVPSKHLKCPTCLKTPNPDKVSAILSDAMAFRDNNNYNRPFDPEDPIIVTETEVYCNVDCYVIAVVRQERGL
jgi:hypothetical protein